MQENSTSNQEEPSNKPRRGRRKGQTYDRRKRQSDNLNLYIFKVLKQVHPEIGLSKKSMAVINSFILDIFDKLATEAAQAVKYSKGKTMDARSLQCAVRLVLPGELAKHAENEANKAIKKYSQTTKKNSK